MQHYLQQLGHGSNLDMHQQMNGKEAVVHISVECYSVIKRKAFESVLMRQMKLEPIIQSEIIQKEEDKYCILTCIYYSLEGKL